MYLPRFSLQSAFGLLEILLSLLILSLGLLSFAGSQLHALRDSRESYEQTTAVIQLSSMLERLCVNHSEAARQKELIAWNKLNQQLLPDGKGIYSCHNSQCTVSLSWGVQKRKSLSLEAEF